MGSLSKFEMAETSVLHLKDAGDEPMYADGPDGKPDLAKPIRVHLYGPGSKQYAKAQNARLNHSVDLLKRKGKTKETADEAIEATAEFLAACTQRFDNADSDTGATGAELALEIYSNQRLSFIRDQVNLFLSETANFSAPSATASASTSGSKPG